MNGIIIAAIVVAGLGLLIGIVLGVVGKVFEVEENEQEAAIRECLPGNNCGGCGYAGCDALAAAIANGEAKADACPVGGADVAAQIAEITGGEIDNTRNVAYVHCCGTNETASVKYTYSGNLSCKEAATMVGGGPKSCSFGCLGFGSCVSACQFDAIHIVNGVAVVDKEACKGCSACIKECPRHIIDLVDYNKKVHVQCSSKQKGKEVMAVCKSGCIGCGMCEKTCRFDAIHVVDNIAIIDYDKCKSCGACALKCPKKCITNERKVAAKPAAENNVAV